MTQYQRGSSALREILSESIMLRRLGNGRPLRIAKYAIQKQVLIERKHNRQRQQRHDNHHTKYNS